jgi:hypothetical protein
METNVTPIRPVRTLDDWKTYIAEASATEIDAIIEKGRRITEFHDWFRLDGWKLNRTWDQACKEVVLVGKAACSHYETVYMAQEVFSSAKHFLPPDATSLYYLARSTIAHRDTFDEALKSGSVHPAMTRDDAQTIANRAEAWSANGEDDNERIIKWTRAGHNGAWIARKLGWDRASGGTLDSHNARSLVNKRQKKLGLKPPSKKTGKTRPTLSPVNAMMERPLLTADYWTSMPKGEERIGLDSNQKVHLFAFDVKQLIDAQSATRSFVPPIMQIGSSELTAERFMELLDQMLTWEPDKTRPGTGWDTDFAAKAHKTMDTLDRYLTPAVERLQALQALIAQRRG